MVSDSSEIRVPLASSGLEGDDIEAVIETLRSNALTMGSKVRAFERAMADYLDVKHFVMVNSGSSANLAIIESLMRPTNREPRLRAGDGVLVPSIAWPTTIWPLVQLGLKPIFVDVDPETVAIDLADAAQRLASSKHQAKAVFPIHPLGWALDPNHLSEFCKKHSLLLISDVCEALGSWRGGQHAGMSSAASSFSFYFSHHITTMEGGGIATADDALADDLRSIRSHGWSRDRIDSSSWSSIGNDVNSRFLFVSTGYNIRPMEIQAALGLGQIQRIDQYVSRRREIAAAIHSAIQDTEIRLLGSQTLNADARSHSWMLLPIKTKSSEHARAAVSYLDSVGVETRPVLTGNFTAQPSLGRIMGEEMNPRSYRQADIVSSTCFMVGCHHHFSDSQVEHLAQSLVKAATLGQK